jgi:hypothetical protein
VHVCVGGWGCACQHDMTADDDARLMTMTHATILYLNNSATTHTPIPQVESMAYMGAISGPGSWAFPDCLVLGVPGIGCLTWEESKSHLALYAISSSPLFLGNDGVCNISITQ